MIHGMIVMRGSIFRWGSIYIMKTFNEWNTKFFRHLGRFFAIEGIVNEFFGGICGILDSIEAAIFPTIEFKFS